MTPRSPPRPPSHEPEVLRAATLRGYAGNATTRVRVHAGVELRGDRAGTDDHAVLATLASAIHDGLRRRVRAIARTPGDGFAVVADLDPWDLDTARDLARTLCRVCREDAAGHDGIAVAGAEGDGGLRYVLGPARP